MSIPQNFKNRIVPFDSLIGKNLDGSIFRYVNRESSESQKENHESKIAALREAHARLGISAQFIEAHKTGSGSIKILYDFFDSHDLNLARLGGTYWEFLEKKLREGLKPDKKLYAVFCTRSRMMRPLGFNTRKKSTWEYTEDDYQIFNRWLVLCFDERATDIIFAFLSLGTAIEDRIFEIDLGKLYSGNLGGRPKKFDFATSKGRTQFRKMLEEKAIELRLSREWDAADIEEYFERKWKGEAAKYLRRRRAIELWLKKAGCPAPPGRRKKEAVTDIAVREISNLPEKSKSSRLV